MTTDTSEEAAVTAGPVEITMAAKIIRADGTVEDMGVVAHYLADEEKGAAR